MKRNTWEVQLCFYYYSILKNDQKKCDLFWRWLMHSLLALTFLPIFWCFICHLIPQKAYFSQKIEWMLKILFGVDHPSHPPNHPGNNLATGQEKLKSLFLRGILMLFGGTLCNLVEHCSSLYWLYVVQWSLWLEYFSSAPKLQVLCVKNDFAEVKYKLINHTNKTKLPQSTWEKEQRLFLSV